MIMAFLWEYYTVWHFQQRKSTLNETIYCTRNYDLLIMNCIVTPAVEKFAESLGFMSFDSKQKLPILALDLAVVHIGLDSLIRQFSFHVTTVCSAPQEDVLSGINQHAIIVIQVVLNIIINVRSKLATT